MTFPGTGVFPGIGLFPGSSDYETGTATVPYVSVGAWASSGVDANGCRWVNTGMTGIDDPPPVKGDQTPRPNDNGSFDAPVYDDDRVGGWTGHVICPDRATRALAKLALAKVARALRDGVDLVAHMEDGGLYTMRAKRASGWSSGPFGPLGWRYSAVFTCTDPYKYGPLVTTPPTALPAPGPGGLVFPLFDGTGFMEFGPAGQTGQASLSNAGTTETYEVDTITGPVLGGLVLTELGTGRQLVYADDVPSGANLVIDQSTGSVELNGADRSDQLDVAQWWSVAGGTTSTVQFATLGVPGQAGFLTRALRPTYE